MFKKSFLFVVLIILQTSSFSFSCTEKGDYAITTSTYCASTACCNPPSSYWGCPPSLGGSDPTGYLGKCVCSSTGTATNYFCPLNSCSQSCSPNSILGCSLTCASDIGIKVYDGTQFISIGVESIGTLTSPLRISKNGIIYGIILVEINDVSASRIRIQTNVGIKSIKKLN